MVLLCRARATLTLFPLSRWRSTLGLAGGGNSLPTADARRLAGAVERAADRLPFETKCLPRAMALSWMLCRRGIAHSVVFAVRPADRRHSADALHAWVEVGGSKILGELPGPWIETLRLGS